MNRPQKVRLKNLMIGKSVFMEKHSIEFKKQIVMDYLNGYDGT